MWSKNHESLTGIHLKIAICDYVYRFEAMTGSEVKKGFTVRNIMRSNKWREFDNNSRGSGLYQGIL
jgi:hypothetical protein